MRINPIAILEWFLELEFFAQGLIVIAVLGIVAVCIVVIWEYKWKDKCKQKEKAQELERACGKMS